MIEKAPRRAVDAGSERVVATRLRLFEAAERVFLEHPYDDVSVRTINAAAGMNPGATHYHFGSKEGLVVALVEERLANRTRQAGDELSAFEAQPAVQLEDILGLAVDPLLTLASGSPLEQLWVHLLATVLLRGSDVPFVSESFSLDRWSAVVARAVPDVPPTTLRTRWELVVILLLHLTGRPLGRVPHDRIAIDRDGLIAYLAAGLRAPE